jgi:hypothetical protein
MTDMIYLTNGLCEYIVNEDTEAALKAAGLDYRFENKELIPFSEEEGKYLTDDVIDRAEGFGVMLGYTVLLEGKKWFAPTTEVYYGSENNVTETQAGEITKRLEENLKDKIEAVGGRVIVELDGMPDRHVVTSLIPFEHAAEKATNLIEWVEYLESDLLNDTVAFKAGPTI